MERLTPDIGNGRPTENDSEMCTSACVRPCACVCKVSVPSRSDYNIHAINPGRFENAGGI